MKQATTTPYFSTSLPPAEAYKQLVADGLITHDDAQQAALAKLQTLFNQLLKKEDPKFRLFTDLFANKKKQRIQSMYIWGGVGRGKSMLMDLFYDTLVLTKKRRVHFHRFMQDVHAQLHELRKQGHTDHMERMIKKIAAAQDVLCFDELQATDVADASLITRIFEGLMAQGVVVVATSNRPPAALYQGEVQKERFERLTQLINQHFDVLKLDGDEDHRRGQVQALTRTYFTPLGVSADMFVQETLAQLSPCNHEEINTLEVHGRTLALRSYGERVALASFDELCGAALGAADYIAIAQMVEVLIFTDIPILSPEKRNEAKRFVLLVDALYEHHVLCIFTADAPPDMLYARGHGSFEFERTASRLMEMQSHAYRTQANS